MTTQNTIAQRRITCSERRKRDTSDRRVVKTFENLIEAFEKLLREKDYDEISVSELCEAANIRRMTFYNHFSDKNDFIMFYIRRFNTTINSRLDAIDDDESACDYAVRLADEVIDFFQEYESRVLRTVGTLILDQFEWGVFDAFAERIQSRIEKSGATASSISDRPDVCARFAAGAVMGAIRSYARDAMDGRIGDRAETESTLREATKKLLRSILN